MFQYLTFLHGRPRKYMNACLPTIKDIEMFNQSYRYIADVTNQFLLSKKKKKFKNQDIISFDTFCIYIRYI